MSYRHLHRRRAYRSRRVAIRGKADGVDTTDVAELEKLTKQLLDDVLKEHSEELEEIATYIEEDAKMIVPRMTGALEESIMVRTSRNPLRPGIIAHASASNAGFDYALIQEENEWFEHNSIRKATEADYRETGIAVGAEIEDDSGRSAHYLGGPFAKHLSEFYEDITGKELDLPEELRDAMEYVEDLI